MAPFTGRRPKALLGGPPHLTRDTSPRLHAGSKRKNAVIKITGACTLSKEPYPFPDIWDPLARIFDARAGLA